MRQRVILPDLVLASAERWRGLEVFRQDDQFFVAGERGSLTLPDGWGRLAIAEGSEEYRQALMWWLRRLGPCWFEIGERRADEWLRIAALAPEANLCVAIKKVGGEVGAVKRAARREARIQAVKLRGGDVCHLSGITGEERIRLSRIEKQPGNLH